MMNNIHSKTITAKLKAKQNRFGFTGVELYAYIRPCYKRFS
jgi:hypothetical protein